MVIIPKKISEYLGVSSDTSLNISHDGKRIIIEIIQEKEPFIDKDGTLVFTGQLDNRKSKFIQYERKI